MKNPLSQIAAKTKTSILLVLALSWLVCGYSYADSLSVMCQVGTPKSPLSRITVRATGLKGSYYATVFSGEDEIHSENIAVKRNGLLQFKFDSVFKPNVTALPQDFIKRKTVISVLRNAESHKRIGAIRTPCSIRKPKPIN